MGRLKDIDVCETSSRRFTNVLSSVQSDFDRWLKLVLKKYTKETE